MHLQDHSLAARNVDDAVGLLALAAALTRDLHRLEALWTEEEG